MIANSASNVSILWLIEEKKNGCHLFKNTVVARANPL